MSIDNHTCIMDDGGTPNRKCGACIREAMANGFRQSPIDTLITAVKEFLDLTGDGSFNPYDPRLEALKEMRKALRGVNR